MTRPRIVSNPGIMHGAPCIAGTRIPTEMVRSFDYDAITIRDQYPTLTYDQINTCIVYELRWHRRLRRWLAQTTLGVRCRVAGWMLGVDPAWLREEVE